MLRSAFDKLTASRALLRERILVGSSTKSDVIRDFHRLYYESWRHLDQDTTRLSWLGVRTMKCPLDLWMYQEILVGIRPRLIIETGTLYGGSALFLAGILDLMGGEGHVISIDVRSDESFPRHPRITYLTGSSTSEAIVAAVTEQARVEGPIMCLLDSDHGRAHVLDELDIYGDLVTVGSYLVVEDTNVNGHPVYPDHGPGPMEAVREFLERDDRYIVDESRERFLLTMNPRGYLKRVR